MLKYHEVTIIKSDDLYLGLFSKDAFHYDHIVFSTLHLKLSHHLLLVIQCIHLGYQIRHIRTKLYNIGLEKIVNQSHASAITPTKVWWKSEINSSIIGRKRIM